MVSVIVPMYNAAPYLAGLLESLALQVVSEPWEIIAVDNGSTDESIAIATGVQNRLSIRVVSASAKRNPSFARNEGVRHAAGEKLVFIDADDQVDSRYVECLAQALNSHAFVTSKVDSVVLNPPWVRNAHGPAWQTNSVGTFFGFLPAAGINIGIQRPLFDALGGFPEEFSGSEDMAFSWLAQLAGAQIQFVPEAVYFYRYRDSLAGLFRQAKNWGRDNVLLYARFRAHGMPGRSVGEGVRDWLSIGRDLLLARGRSGRAPVVARAGFCVGRVTGSVRYGVWYV